MELKQVCAGSDAEWGRTPEDSPVGDGRVFQGPFSVPMKLTTCSPRLSTQPWSRSRCTVSAVLKRASLKKVALTVDSPRLAAIALKVKLDALSK